MNTLQLIAQHELRWTVSKTYQTSSIPRTLQEVLFIGLETFLSFTHAYILVEGVYKHRARNAQWPKTGDLHLQEIRTYQGKAKVPCDGDG